MRVHLLAAIAVVAFGFSGCEKPVEDIGKNPPENSHNHSHDGEHADHEDEGHADHDESGHADHADHDDEGDHGHGHSDEEHAAHGPNNGHVFPIESADYQGEWCKFPGTSLIKMHILDKDQQPASLKVDSFHVIPQTGNDPTPFVLEAESPDDDGKSSVYMLDDQNLHIAIPLGVKIEIVAGDKKLKGEIKAHKPLDH